MMHLIDDYYLDADRLCYMLVKWDGTWKKADINGRIKKSNPEFKYYSNLDGLILGLFRCLSRDAITKLSTLEELGSKISEINTFIKETIDKLVAPDARLTLIEARPSDSDDEVEELPYLDENYQE